MTTRKKPVLAVTMGDPAGIGPEIAVKLFASGKAYETSYPIVVGHPEVMLKAIDLVGGAIILNTITDVKDAKFEMGIMNVYDIGGEDVDTIRYGEVSALAGDLAFRSVTTAIDLALKKEVDGTVTGPIHKESINKAGHKFAGHTEIYAHYTGTKKYAMLLVEESFKVIHVSTHVSLRQACDLVKKDRVLEVIHLINNGLKSLKIENPRIGVAGLNPHASDGGLFGTEDAEEILPAIEQARKEGVIVDGPVPPDTLFAMAYGGKYDGCVAMYHDQGHIPFKVIGFNWDQKTKKMKSVKGVNITMGLPIIRTSVDHGTAFEIAGKGIASPDALFHAIEYAEKLTI
ncbi:4-hydroxythreonine-4-phosphate dehydrogenase PdxA [Marinoscillum sp. MHG1-6]|uniref:4-hydroxythreonine-4-phosphate dehydrogenase PdxA n=1 Tax=Marinoscillum sp. MHG1-6 TaxID=2959627 RepID=UPI0021582692|nr:4-hydroxythreonine-4-phosphate dehydrogenase PdxA [Marinoscillum sp. MHG1-6]